MRPVVSSQGWLVDLSLRSPRQRWWRKSQTTRDKTQPCLRGKSETDCWQRASATTTPFPASHPLTGRKQQPNTTQSTYLGCCDAYSILIVFGERTGCRIFREDELKVRMIHPTCVWARRPRAEYCLTQVCVEAFPWRSQRCNSIFQTQLPQQSAVHPGLSECVEMKTDQYSVTRSRGAIKKANFLERI